MTNSKRPAGGLTAIRRFYFYIVAFVSLVAGLAALDKLLEALDTAWLGGAALFDVGGNAFTCEVLAASGGVLLVAAPIFLLHWRFIQQRQDDPDERHSGLRKLFLYLASAVAIGYVLFRAYDLLYGVAVLAFGQPLVSSKIWPDGWLYNLLMLAAAWSLEAYLHHVVVADGDYGRERDNTGVWRRLFHVTAGLVGLGLILFGAAGILETTWRTATGGIDNLVTGWWRPEAWAHGVALLLIGAVLARINWRRWRVITVENADEARAALRRFYLYVAVATGAIAALAPAASILREALLIVFGSGAGDAAELLRKIATPVSFVPVGAVIWLWHRRFLQREAEEYGESEEGAAVRRLYYYVVAATGLTLLWFGAVNIVGAALDWLLRNGVQSGVGGLWAEPLATGLSLLTVGAPVWALHWRAVQRVAQEEDAAGLAERTSLTRRAYLYGVALVGAPADPLLSGPCGLSRAALCAGRPQCGRVLGAGGGRDGAGRDLGVAVGRAYPGDPHGRSHGRGGPAPGNRNGNRSGCSGRARLPGRRALPS